MDADKANKSLQKQLNGGASSLVLLSLLHQQKRQMYGYEIAKELERRNGGTLPMNPGALYPVLRSLEKQGLLSSHSELSDEGRARKYYKVTKAGGETIGHWETAWRDTQKFINTILEHGDDNASRKRNSAVSRKTSKGTAKRAT